MRIYRHESPRHKQGGVRGSMRKCSPEEAKRIPGISSSPFAKVRVNYQASKREYSEVEYLSQFPGIRLLG